MTICPNSLIDSGQKVLPLNRSAISNRSNLLRRESITKMLTEAQVRQFQELYKTEFGQEISYEEALESAQKLVVMTKLIYRPIEKFKFEEFKQKLKLKPYDPRIPAPKINR